MVDCNPSLIDDLRDTVIINVIDTVLIPELIVRGSVNVSESDTAKIVDIESGIEIEIITRPIGLSLNDPLDTIPRFNISATATIPRDTIIVDRFINVPCPDPIVVDNVAGSIGSIRIKSGAVGFVVGVIVILLIIRAVRFVVGKPPN